jgi:MFS family permease
MVKIGSSPEGLRFGNRDVHYAWVIVAVAALIRLAGSMVRQGQGILVSYLHNPANFGWGYGSIGFGFTLSWISSGLFGPPAGWLGDKYGVRRIMIVGAILFMIGSVLTGTMTSLWQFYLYFGIIMSLSMAIFLVPLEMAVTTWFKKHLGVGMGILGASQGLGAGPGVLLVIFLLNEFGLRWTFWLPGLAGGVIILLLAKFFYDEPAAKGMRPLGATDDEPIRKVGDPAAAGERSKVFLQHAQRTPAFWNLIGIHFWGCAGHAIILAFLAAMAESKGVPQGLAGGLLITLSIVSMVTRFAVPIIADRMGSKFAMAACFFLQSSPILILFFFHDTWAFYLFAVLFGIGLGGEMSAFPIINRQYYGNAPLSTAYGWQIFGAMIGMAAGSFLGGLAWDVTGSYNATLGISLIMSLVGAISVILLPTTSRHLIPHWEDSLLSKPRLSEAAPGQPAGDGDS